MFNPNRQQVCAPDLGAKLCNLSHLWDKAGTFDVLVRAEDVWGEQSDFSSPLAVIVSSNAPDTPTITGPTSGKVGNSYTYSASTTDPDGDNVYYLFDWDDGNDSGWKGPYMSGETCKVSHIWGAQGTYSIKVKAKDEYDDESGWATLEVTMPKNKPYINPLFLRFLENHPHLFPLIRQILGL